MTDDLDTLLRDAGREPTVDLDVDAIAAAGRRRAVGRRVAGAAAAVALLAAVVIVPGLLPTGTPDIDIAPQPSGEEPRPSGTESDADAPTDGAGGAGTAAIDDAPLAASMGLDVVRVRRVDADLVVTTTAADGEVSTRTWPGGEALLPLVEVAPDGSVWATAPTGDTRRLVEEGTIETQLSGDGTAWTVVGVSEQGPVAIRQPNPPDAGPVEAAVRVVGPDGLVEVPGTSVTTDGVCGDADELWDAAVGLEVVIGVLTFGESECVVAFPAGADPVDLEAPGGDRWIVDTVVVGRRVLVLANVDAGDRAVLMHLDLDAEGEGWVEADLDLPDGTWPVGLGLHPGSGQLVVDARPPSSTEDRSVLVLDAGAADPAATARAVAGDGVVRFADAAAPPEPAAAPCADAPVLNGAPGAELGVWFVCWDAAQRLGEDAYAPFVRVDDRFTAAEPSLDAEGIAAALEVWAAGPTPAEEAAGLSGGLDPVVASLGRVTIDGTTVVVDVLPGEQAGILSTSAGGAVFTQSVAAVVLQFDGRGDLVVDELVITLDGSCEQWGEFVQAGGCPTYDVSSTPWGQ